MDFKDAPVLINFDSAAQMMDKNRGWILTGGLLFSGAKIK